MATLLSLEPPGAQHEPQGQLLGQRGGWKKEQIKKQIYKNRTLALAGLTAYIDTFYNATRRHSHLGGVSPEQFEAAHVRPQRRGVH